MSMTMVVTSDVAPRIRGFLASCMLEVASGVYVSPLMTRAVRERVWNVISGWFQPAHNGFMVMTWRERSYPGGVGLLLLGTPPRELREHDGLFLARRDLPQQEETKKEETKTDSSLKSE